MKNSRRCLENFLGRALKASLMNLQGQKMNKNMIAEGTTMGATTHSHKEHAIAIAPFYSSFFESLHKEQWQEVRLGEMIKTNCKSIDKNYPYNMVQYLDTGSITDNKIESFQQFDLVDLPSRAKRLVQDNDIIYSLVRPIQRHFGFIKNPRKNLIVSTGFCTITTYQNILDSKFLYYFLTFDETIEFLDLIAEASTSAYPAIKPSDIENLIISLPPLKVQQQIAEILSSFDDKIDVLHRQNKTLESLALTLFRHTFIDNPKNSNAPCHSRQACNCHSEPALAGEESIDIKLHRDISASPQYDKWEMGKLGDYGKIICGKTPTKTQKEYFNGEIPFIKIPDMHNKTFVFKTADTLTQKGFSSQHTKTLPPLSICVSCIATVGVVSMNALESQTNQQINSIVPHKEYFRYFLYCFMKQSFDELQAMASGGTATANLNTTDFSNMAILKPADKELQNFHSCVKIYFDKIYNNAKQIQNLQSMRDVLLSKILNEKMEV